MVFVYTLGYSSVLLYLLLKFFLLGTLHALSIGSCASLTCPHCFCFVFEHVILSKVTHNKMFQDHPVCFLLSFNRPFSKPVLHPFYFWRMVSETKI